MENYKQIVEKSTLAEEIIDAINNLINQHEFDERLIPTFVKYLKSDNMGLRDASYRILINYPNQLKSKVAENVAPIIETRAIEFRNLAGDILLRLGYPSVKPLIKYLKVDDFDIRKFACDIIGLVDDGNMLDTIMQLYDDNDTNVVLSSIEAVGNIFYNNQTNVDKAHIIASLTELFETNNEVLKPQIVETLGKIGGKDAENFLLYVLRNEQDFFVRIAAIDSLAIVGSDIEICNMLLSEINNYPYDIQTVVLKTAIAIGYRIDSLPELPLEGREIARRALIDTDNDISSAGLVAIGNTYEIDDIKNLAIFYEKADYDTQKYIQYNLFENSENEVVHDFLNNIFECHIDQDSVSVNLDFISTLLTIWNDISSSRKPYIVKELFKLVLNTNCINNNELIELFAKFNDNELQSAIETIILENPDLLKSVDDLFEKIYYFK